MSSLEKSDGNSDEKKGTDMEVQVAENGSRAIGEAGIDESRKVKHRMKLTGAFAWSLSFFVLVAVALIFLAISLYNTSADLKSVQVFSKGLQTKLLNTEAKLHDTEERLRGMEIKNTEPEPEKQEEPVSTDEKVPNTSVNPKPTLAVEGYVVCIDAGHGAHDSGAVYENEDGTKRQEKDDNLRLSKLVQAELEKYGVKVLMTREDDSFLELYDRTFFANSMDVDLLISFHRNAYYSGGKMHNGVSGVEIWVHSSRPTRDRQLANRILDDILEIGDMIDRGVRYGSVTDANEDYAINRRSLMPSMIVEMGFISNEGDNEDFDKNGEAYAKAIAEEIYEWLCESE